MRGPISCAHGLRGTAGQVAHTPQTSTQGKAVWTLALCRKRAACGAVQHIVTRLSHGRASLAWPDPVSARQGRSTIQPVSGHATACQARQHKTVVAVIDDE